MSHNPLSLTTIGFLAPAGGGSTVNVPVTALSAAAIDASTTARLANGQVGVGIHDRTPVSALDNSKRLLIKVDNGQS